MNTITKIIICAVAVVTLTVGFFLEIQYKKNHIGFFEIGKVYPLAFTQQYGEVVDGNRVGQSFVTPNTCGLSVPLAGPRGEKMIFTAQEAGEELSDSSFKIVRRTSPAVMVGAATFQPEYSYTVVVFNATLGHQNFVPVYGPSNDCSP